MKEKTNREGFFENREFIVFKKIITGILEETGRRRAKYRESHGLGRGKAKDKFERPDAEKFIQYLALKISDPEVIRLSEEFVAKSNAVLDNMQETLTLSERLATLGTGLELVYHELAQPITAIGGSVASLEIYNKKIQEDFLNKTFKEITANIDGSINTIGELKESLRPAIGKSRPKIFKPIDTFVKVIRLFKDKIDENSITITISSNLNNYKINELEYPLWVSFLNIINNAIYWLKFADKEKIINFQLSDNEVLSISNTGPKILDDELEVIFQYGITGKKERDATGLGLAFSRNILRRIDWEVWAENDTIGPVFFIKKI